MNTLVSDRPSWLNNAYEISEGNSPVSEDSLASTIRAQEDARRSWQRAIDFKLVEWGRDPSQFEDDDVIAPSRVAIDVAVFLASTLRDRGFPPPDALVPDGDGGIAFERWDSDLSESLEVSGDGEIEYVQLRAGRVVDRHRIP